MQSDNWWRFQMLQDMTQDPEAQLKSKSFPPPETLSKDLGKAAGSSGWCVEMVSQPNEWSCHGLILRQKALIFRK